MDVDSQVALTERLTQTSKNYFTSLKSFDNELKSNFTRRIEQLGRTTKRSQSKVNEVRDHFTETKKELVEAFPGTGLDKKLGSRLLFIDLDLESLAGSIFDDLQSQLYGSADSSLKNLIL